MKKLLLTAILATVFVPIAFSQSEGPSLEDCGAWLHENTNYRSRSGDASTNYEKNTSDPNLAKLTYSHHKRNSGWIEEYTFRWSDIATVEISYVYNKKLSLHYVKMKFVSKNNESLITRKHIASGNAIVGNSITNGSVIEKFSWFRTTVSAHPDQASATATGNRFLKIAQRILDLSTETKSGIDNSFFND